MHALVTGAGGFLGRYIVEQLVARGDRVRTLSRADYPELRRLGVQAIQADIQDQATVDAACENVDAVFHTAAVAKLWGPWREFHGINVIGTHNVIAACRNHRVPRLVFTSSPSVTFAGRDQRGVDESAPYPACWLAHYPHTKALAEQAVLQANNGTTLLTCALRPHLIWGPRDQHLVPRLLDRARQGQLRQVGDGQNLVDTIFVENAASAHLQAADALAPGAAACGRAYFLSQGKPVNCWAWINEILALARLPSVTKRISMPAAYAAGSVLETAWTLLRRHDEPRMTRFLAAQLGTSHYFDISAAQRDFGYRPQISHEEGMRRLAAELQSAGG